MKTLFKRTFCWLAACSAFFSVSFSLAQTPMYSANDLVGTSNRCKEEKAQNPEISLCNLKTTQAESISNLKALTLTSVGTDFSNQLRSSYFEKINSSLTSQFAAVMWLGKTNPLKDRSGQRIQNALKASVQKCTGANQKPINDLKSRLESVQPLQELGFTQVPPEQLERSRETINKRMLIAWIEANRIDRFLADRALSKPEKAILRDRLKKIKETYPIMTTAPGGYSLRKLAMEEYGNIHRPDSTEAHPEIDRILFPHPEKGYAEIKIQPGKQGNEGYINNILTKPLAPRVENELANMMRLSLENSLKSINAFCGLSPCQSMAVSLQVTSEKLSSLPPEQSKTAFQAACSCDLSTPTEFLSSGKQLALAGASIGGLVLCPFTLGVGCYGSIAAGSALTAGALANTYGAIQDTRNLNPLVQTVFALPGLSAADRKRIQDEASDANGRTLAGVVDVATGVIPGGKAAVGNKASRAAHEIQGLSSDVGPKYDEILQLKKEIEAATDETAVVGKKARLAALEKEVTALNEKRHKLLKIVRSNDASPNSRKMQKIESEMIPMKYKIRDLNEQITRLKLIAKHSSGAEARSLKTQIEKLEAEALSEQKKLGPLQKSWDQLAAETPPERRLKQITGKEIEIGKQPPNMETPDPTLYKSADGRVLMMGSGQRYYEYDSINQFLRGDKVPAKTFDLRYPDGTKMKGPYHTGELPWDLSLVRYEDGTEVMYGGALSPKKFRAGGKADDPANTTVMAENWTRSGHAFIKQYVVKDPQTGKETFYKSMDEFIEKNKHKGADYLQKTEVSQAWVRAEKDLFGRKLGQEIDWDNHNYGRRVMTNPDGTIWRDEKGDAWVMYEKVIGRDGKLGDTKMFAQRMKNEFEVKGEPIEIQGTSHTYKDPKTGETSEVRFPSTIRSIDRNLTLVEGPNPTQGFVSAQDMPKMSEADVKAFKERFKGTELENVDPNQIEWQAVGGSTGDYATDNYTLVAGVKPVLKDKPKSQQIGPLIPLTKGNGVDKDFIDFGHDIKKKYGISWGPARPDLFRDEHGKWWVMFHGIDESVVPSNLSPRVWPSDKDIDKIHRNVYVAPVDWKMINGIPHPTIVDGSKPIRKLPTVAPLPLAPAAKELEKRKQEKEREQRQKQQQRTGS